MQRNRYNKRNNSNNDNDNNDINTQSTYPTTLGDLDMHRSYFILAAKTIKTSFM